jgi:hypothetical protein
LLLERLWLSFLHGDRIPNTSRLQTDRSFLLSTKGAPSILSITPTETDPVFVESFDVSNLSDSAERLALNERLNEFLATSQLLKAPTWGLSKEEREKHIVTYRGDTDNQLKAKERRAALAQSATTLLEWIENRSLNGKEPVANSPSQEHLETGSGSSVRDTQNDKTLCGISIMRCHSAGDPASEQPETVQETSLCFWHPLTRSGLTTGVRNLEKVTDHFLVEMSNADAETLVSDLKSLISILEDVSWAASQSASEQEENDSVPSIDARSLRLRVKQGLKKGYQKLRRK